MKRTSKKELKFEAKQKDGFDKTNKKLSQQSSDKENQDPNTSYNCSTPIKSQNQDNTATNKKNQNHQGESLELKTITNGVNQINDKNSYLSPIKTTSSNGGALFSPDSNYSPFLVKATKSDQSILLKVKVPEDEKKEFQVIISNDRPDTNLPKHKQGNHISAYITFIHLLISAVECEDAQEVSSRISKTLENIIPSQEVSNKELLAFNEQKLSTFTSRDSRKRKTASSRAGMQLMQCTQEEIEKEVAELKNIIKSSNNYIIADIIENAGNMLLKCLNKDDHMAIAKIVQDGNGGVEGSVVRSAINCLNTANRIIDIMNEANRTIDIKDEEGNKQYKRLVENFIEDYCQRYSSLKSGLKRIMCSNDKIKDFEINGKIKSQFENLSKNLKNPEIILESKNLFNNLLFNGGSKKVHQTNICDSVSNLFDFKHSENQALANVEPILYKVTARHLAIIFNAFPSLKTLDNENNGIIKNYFLEFVLENQGWKSFSVEINGEFTPLNLEYFNKKIENYLDLKEYKMKTIDKKEDNKEMDDFPQLVFNPKDVAKNLIFNPATRNNICNNRSSNVAKL